MQNNNLALNKKIATGVGRAISDFSMIQSGDSILVGLSGGKDSCILLYALCRLRSKSPTPFSIQAVTVVPDNNRTDLSPLYSFTETLGVNLTVVNYPIFDILEKSPESSPCSLCANIRRGILAEHAKELGCGVLALGHHTDDATETVFLNLLFAGSFKCFQPNMLMSRSGIRVIRPLIYVNEDDIRKESVRRGLPNIDFCCKHSATSKRSLIKQILQDMRKASPFLNNSVIHALTSFERENCWEKSDRRNK